MPGNLSGVKSNISVHLSKLRSPSEKDLFSMALESRPKVNCYIKCISVQQNCPWKQAAWAAGSFLSPEGAETAAGDHLSWKSPPAGRWVRDPQDLCIQHSMAPVSMAPFANTLFPKKKLVTCLNVSRVLNTTLGCPRSFCSF